jgi:hypothetical protein
MQGYFLLRGVGTEKDAKAVARCFEKAAQQGHVAAINWLTSASRDGSGVETDLAKARELWARAADAQHSFAQFNFATMLAAGKCGPVDMKRAFHYYELAAQHDDPDAQLALGCLCFSGEATGEPDIQRAIEWLKRCAWGEDADDDNVKGDAMFQLSLIYGGFDAKGNEHAPLDEAEARLWLRRASDGGNKDAKYVLGTRLLNGAGDFEKDEEAGRKLLQQQEEGTQSARRRRRRRC